MDSKKKWTIIIALVSAAFVAYFFIYKPYFTTEGMIHRTSGKEIELEKNVIFNACGLPENHRYYQMFKKECDELKLRAEYEETQQDCTPNYMGGCD
jgi:hypothetical protein